MAKRKLSSDINVVPYIDVMLVLLIIFMVTAPLLVQGIQVDLPEANAESMSSQQNEVYMSVDRDGQLFLTVGENQAQPLSDEQLIEQVTKLVQTNPDQLIYVEGDSKADYGHVARGMALLQQAGARKIGFVTKPVENAK
ncbi:protein TolR [Sinimarinibacterium thermocellulolyticum]|uniref:Tol-Pal system protein TolR n=1 Tax=Sinimarinibacterium thermocellulolyticum TaxID=3170016 RepID=A0ABV2AAK6_9GAMM